MHDASDDPAVAARWWRWWPRANIGGLTGLVFDVDDLDGVGAAESLENAAPGSRGLGPVSQTGKGGHRFCAVTGLGNRTPDRRSSRARPPRQRRRRLAGPGHARDRYRYRWRAGPDTPLMWMPRVLADIVDPPKRPPAWNERTSPVEHSSGGWSSAGLLRTMTAAVDGNSNSTLFWAASRVVEDLHAGRVTPRAATDTLDDLEVAARAVGLDGSEITRTIRSALMRGSA